MIKLSKPTLSARSAFSTCISRVRNPDLATRLSAATTTVTAESDTYDNVARIGQIHTIKASDIALPDITSDEMTKVYNQRMAKIDAPGRQIYDKIITSTPNGLCPLCAQRFVSTLDHHLPKAHYPALAVTPVNLVPSCADCNKAKLDICPSKAEEVSLQPYYDDLGDGVWLMADVIEKRPAALRYRIEPMHDWPASLCERVERHFKTLKLGPLYASAAAEELVSIRFYLNEIWNARNAAGVHDDLIMRAHSTEQVRANSWRSAAYRAWANSSWFCAGGFAGT